MTETTSRKIRVGITHGDTNGVGYELILKAFANVELFDFCTPIVYGSDKVASYHRKALENKTVWRTIDSADAALEGQLNLVDVVGDTDVKIQIGEPSAEAGKMARLALEAAVADAKVGKIDVLVTCPINKASIQSTDFQFPGHTEYLQQTFDQEGLMILMDKTMRVALVTTHLPISKVAEEITAERVETKLRQIHLSLKRDFCLSAPRIAVLSLNPHCGDAGLIGREEDEIIRPLIHKMNEESMPCFGPYSADGFFGASMYRHFDAVLAMYHDQGLAAFKALSMDEGVNFTSGLSIVRTSPDHGTAYDIAGKGVASEASFLQAIYSAIDIYRNRQRYDEAHANPLGFEASERRENRRQYNS